MMLARSTLDWSQSNNISCYLIRLSKFISMQFGPRPIDVFVILYSFIPHFFIYLQFRPSSARMLTNFHNAFIVGHYVTLQQSAQTLRNLAELKM